MDKVLFVDLSKSQRDLLLFCDNERDIENHIQACYNNMARRIKKKTFNAELAVKLFRYPVDEANRLYYKKFKNRFSVEDRNMVAKYLRDDFDFDNKILTGVDSFIDRLSQIM